MAENKKAVLIYADWIHVAEKLSDAEAGALFKHLLRYVNDQNPEPPDRLTEITFEPWKQTLKRNLKKWEHERERFSKAGQASAKARAQRKEQEPTTLIVVEPATESKAKTKGSKKAEKVIMEEKRDPNEKIDLAPFDESFRPNWQRWITYKRVEHGTKYKRLDTEQAQFKHLVDLSGRNAVIAEKIISQSIVGTWKGFFKLKDNGTQENNRHSNGAGNSGRFDKFDDEYRKQFGDDESEQTGADDVAHEELA